MEIKEPRTHLLRQDRSAAVTWPDQTRPELPEELENPDEVTGEVEWEFRWSEGEAVRGATG